MSIVSYAQNFEDVMLWRALGKVENGFYIDIGAQHPVIDSVSKAFYDNGWRGIHVAEHDHRGAECAAAASSALIGPTAAREGVVSHAAQRARLGARAVRRSLIKPREIADC